MTLNSHLSSQLCSPEMTSIPKKTAENSNSSEVSNQKYNEDLEKEEENNRKPIQNELSEQDLMEVR